MPGKTSTNLSNILSSKGRIRILELLNSTVELNVSEIAKRVGLNYSTTNKHLEELESAGLLHQKRFGRIRIYEYSENSPHALAIKKLIESWALIDAKSTGKWKDEQ
ncbi:MAG: winged helix-turn-helix domain-containing protein [archaeon]